MKMKRIPIKSIAFMDLVGVLFDGGDDDTLDAVVDSFFEMDLLPKGDDTSIFIPVSKALKACEVAFCYMEKEGMDTGPLSQLIGELKEEDPYMLVCIRQEW